MSIPAFVISEAVIDSTIDRILTLGQALGDLLQFPYNYLVTVTIRKKEMKEITPWESHVPTKCTVLVFEPLLPSSELSSAVRDHDLDFPA